jgi:hypothetical protein
MYALYRDSRIYIHTHYTGIRGYIYIYMHIIQGFEDEDVKVAERPKEPSAAEGFLGSLGAKVSQAINWVPEQDK